MRELLSENEQPVVELRNAAARGRGRMVLVCEHASAAIPAALGDLGLGPDARYSHIAWDLGAFGLAERLATLLSAPLVAARVSRLVYDCNRPPEVRDAIPAFSEVFEVPGNRDLSAEDRARRASEVYEPFHAEVASTLDAAAAPVLVTVHSFTPVYCGQSRAVEIGLLHDDDRRLAEALLCNAGRAPLSRFVVRRNEPYGPEDGVTHTLRRHGLRRGLLNVMIEVRNDLIRDAAGQAEVAEALAGALGAAIAAVSADAGREG